MTDETICKVYCVWTVFYLSQIFELSTILEGCISYPYVIILSIILMVYLVGQSIVCYYTHVLGKRLQFHRLLHTLLISTLKKFTFCSHNVLMWIKCNVYTICRQTQLNTRWYANLLNVNLNNYMFRPQSLAIIRLYKRKLIN